MSSTRTEMAALWRLALPIVGTNLGNMLMGTVDTLMVGRVGPEALAAVLLGNVFVSGTMMFAMGVVFGVDPIVSQAHGARDSERAGLALQRGVVIAVAIGALLALLWAFTGDFLLWAGQSPELAAEAHRYVLVQIPSIPLFMVFTAMRQYLQGRGILRPAFVVVLVANVLNALLNWVLIFGELGLPALGARGAGIATAVTRLFLFVGLLAAMRWWRLHEGAWVPWDRRAVERAGLFEVLRHGLPTGVQLALEVWAFGAAALMAGRLGSTAAAAHSVVLNMASLSFMVPLGISLAAVTRVGNLIGARRHADAQRASWVALCMGAGVMLVFGGLFALLRHELPRLYTSEAEVIALCALVLPIAGAFQVFDGLQVVGGGILRAMGRTLPAAVFNLIAYWVLALPLAWWLAFGLELRLAGVWWGLALGLATAALLLVAWVRARGPARMAGAERAFAGAAPR